MTYPEIMNSLDRTFMVGTSLSGSIHGKGIDILPRLAHDLYITNELRKKIKNDDLNKKGEIEHHETKRLALKIVEMCGLLDEPAYFMNMRNGLEKNPAIEKVQSVLKDLIDDDIDLRMNIGALCYTPYSGCMFGKAKDLLPKIITEAQHHYKNNKNGKDPHNYFKKTMQIIYGLTGKTENPSDIHTLPKEYQKEDLQDMVTYELMKRVEKNIPRSYLAQIPEEV
jgi:hypothetical protein